MNFQDIPWNRLSNQRILSTASARPEDVVFSLGAMQAQDYQGALWAIGLRCKGATKYDIEKAIARKKIIRTWPLRHTLHFVSPQDVRWMLKFYPDEPIPKFMASNGLTKPILEKSLELISKAFKNKEQLTYREMHKALENTGIRALDNNMVQSHIIRRAGREGIICFGSHEGKRPTFALLETWVPKAKHLKREEALAKLASRYFTSHGPATIKDFVWWSGLKVSDARLSIEKAHPKLGHYQIDDKTYYMGSKADLTGGSEPSAHLLPAFDEYLLGYSDRSAVLRKWHKTDRSKHTLEAEKKMSLSYSNGIFFPTIVVDGQVMGIWKCNVKNNKAVITLSPFIKPNNEQSRRIKEVVERYSVFLDMPAVLK